MAKRQPVHSNDEIRAAVALALKGKGRKLAVMIKGCPLDDLASAFSRVGPCYDGMFDQGVFLAGLTAVLASCMGRRQGRAEVAAWAKEARRKRSVARATEGAP